MRQYLDLVKLILSDGQVRTDKQGIGNLAIFGHQMRFDMRDGMFPLITSRSMQGSWKGMVHELLWCLSGSTSVHDLHRHNVHFWDQWATAQEEYWAELRQQDSTLPPYKKGDVGPLYGKQWRAFDGGGDQPFDQIQFIINGLKNYPDDRRLFATPWNPEQLQQMFLAPCHGWFHLMHANGELTLHLFQRSADVPVGVPFNIAEYALLLLMFCQIAGFKPGDLVHTLSDAHIYLNQREHMEELIAREPKNLPTVRLNPEVSNLFDFRYEDIILENYAPHPAMKGIPVAL